MIDFHDSSTPARDRQRADAQRIAPQVSKRDGAASASDALIESATELSFLCSEAHVRGLRALTLELTEIEILVARAREASRQLDRLSGRVAA